jgi:hypothetical protein
LAEIVPGAQVDNTKKYRIFNSIYTEVKLMEGLKYRVNFGPDFTLSRWGRFIGAQTNARKGGDPQASTQSNFGFNWTLENIINYSKTVQKHNSKCDSCTLFRRDRYENYGATTCKAFLLKLNSFTI